jgi:hypothetical protein
MADSDNEKGKGNGMAVISLLSAVSVAAISNWDKIFQKSAPTPTPTSTSAPASTSAPTIAPAPVSTIAPITTTTPTDLAVTISQPKNGSKVPIKSDFAGKFTNLPQNVSLWLYVYATEEHKYYLREIINRGNDGNWQLKSVIIGGSADVGSTYKVGVLVADAASTKTLRSKSKGLSQLPSQKQYSEFSINRQ